MELEIFKKIINENLILPISSDRKIQIEEDTEEKGLKRVTIENIPANALFFTFDGKKQGITNQFFSELEGHLEGINKGCDAVILYEKEGIINVMICELKSFKASSGDYEYQFMNASLFVEYIFAILKRFTNEEFKLNDKFKYFLFRLKEPNKIDKEATYSGVYRMDYFPNDKEMELFQKCYFREITIKAPKNQNVRRKFSWQELFS